METKVQESAVKPVAGLKEIILDSIRHNTKQYTMFLALIAIWVIFSFLTESVFLTPRKLSLREKERIRAARVRAGTPDAEARPTTPNRTSLLGRKADISTWV